MKVLVTGHLGYIGPVLIRLFKEAGHHVVGLDIGYFRECLVTGETEVPPDREIVRDLRLTEQADFEGMDAVIHLAGLSNDPLGAINPELTYGINHQASMRMARMAKEAGVTRFVFASSCSIYGAAGNSGALDETAPFNPVSAYAVSKVKTEGELSEMADDTFSPVYLRNATAYGVSPRIRFDLVLNNLMAWACTTGIIKVMSDGTPWRPLVHIEDISRAALAGIEAPRDAIHNQAFNVGRNDANYQVHDIARAVATLVPSAKLEITGESGGDPRSYKVDFTKALTKLPGFEPQWTLEKGAEELFQWFQNPGHLDRAFDSRFYIRLKQLQHLMTMGKVNGGLYPA
ncbi:MAG: NAD(P)-dependent oxidoreductase [Alphaproteobacteria bacterium]|nr:NAD(P)-dependent oxidoreductase [Alphaproteobacteria bacterium]